MFNRRLLLQALSGAIAAPAAASSKKTVVTILGDSVTAGLGLPADQALPARLQRALIALGVDAVVRGAGVSGDTTAGGLARIDFSVLPDTEVCVVELGANDYFQSVPPRTIQNNLIAILARLKARKISVVLTSNRSPRAGSGSYGREFDAVFAAAARSQAVTLSPNLFEGVLDRPGFRQADGVHPNAAGADLIAHRLAPTVARVIRAREA